MLLQWTLWTVASLATLYFADEFLLNFFCSSPKPFLPLWRLSSDIIFKIFCFFLSLLIVLLRAWQLWSIYHPYSHLVVWVAEKDRMQFYKAFCTPHNIDDYILLYWGRCTLVLMFLFCRLLIPIMVIWWAFNFLNYSFALFQFHIEKLRMFRNVFRIK